MISFFCNKTEIKETTVCFNSLDIDVDVEEIILVAFF